MTPRPHEGEAHLLHWVEWAACATCYVKAPRTALVANADGKYHCADHDPAHPFYHAGNAPVDAALEACHALGG